MTSTRMLYFPQPAQDQALHQAQRAQQPVAVQVQQHQKAAPASAPAASLTDKAFDLSPDLICILDFDGCIRAANPATEKILGFQQSELVGKSLISLVHLEDREGTLGHDRDLLAGTAPLPLENRVRRNDGTYVWLLWNQVALRDQELIFASARDITARKTEEVELRIHRYKLEAQAKEAATSVTRANAILLAEISHRRQVVQSLCEVQEKYRSVFEHAVEGIFQSTPEGKYLSVNPALARIKGYASPEELIADMDDIGEQSYVDPTRRRDLKELMEERGVAMGFEYEAYRKDGRKIWLSLNARAVRDAEGSLLYYEGTVEDITERKRLADQLRLAQKMEAVGRLAGGVAHDFNNLLGVINGHTELLLSRLGEGSSNRWNLDEIAKASRRAAALVRQLLAFSRRQVLQPTVLDLNSVLGDVESMLGRIIGENIVLQTVFEKNLGAVKADQSQIEQVIINLAVNARDAMPQGGKVTIETRNVNAGEPELASGTPSQNYVEISVADTGMGMDAATQTRMFEPFFTTKEQGKGTGLGLATVYGIVKQSGGFISVRSEVDKGSTFQIFLPRVKARPTAIPKQTPAQNEQSRSGTETILLVEDDVALRQLVLSLLLRLGYKVLEAASGAQAVKIAKKLGSKIDLLLTDVVMPGMSGPHLVEEIAAIQPEMKVLFMSGYPEPACADGETLEADQPLLRKPFKQPELARMIREVLEQSQMSGAKAE
jgi:two-component system cell cycle sensor histidine kinase/response regulator CckA